MGNYLMQLEIRAEIENIDLENLAYVIPMLQEPV